MKNAALPILLPARVSRTVAPAEVSSGTASCALICGPGAIPE